MRVVWDISPPISPDTPPFAGDTAYVQRWTARIGPGCPVNVSAITLSPHLGAHADAPLHYGRDAGAIGSVGDLDSDFMVMNGDVLTDLDYTGLMEHHRSTGAIARIATIQREIQVSLGVLRFYDAHQTDRLTAYDEKPSMDYEASMGVYAFSPRVLDYIEEGEHLDFPDLIRRLLDAGEIVRGYRSECYWMDIGRHEDYESAMDDFERLRARLIPGEGYYGDRRRGDDRRRAAERREAAQRRAGLERRDSADAAGQDEVQGDVVPLRRASGV